MTSTGKNSARNCQDGQHRFASMKLIICLERLFNKKSDFIDWMILTYIGLLDATKDEKVVLNEKGSYEHYN